jgi:hypothetical protein
MTSKKFEPCTSDSSCIDGLVCFSNTTIPWVSASYNSSICYCSGLYSYVGDTCDELHPSNNLILLHYALEIIICLIIFGGLSWSLFTLYTISKKQGKKTSEVSMKTPIVHTSILCWLFSIFYLATSALSIECYKNSMPFVYVLGKYKACPVVIPQLITGAIALALGWLTVLDVCVTWVTLVYKIKHLQGGKNRTNSRRAIILVRCLQFFYICAVIICLALLSTALLSLLLIPFAIVIIVLYVFGGFYMEQMIKATSQFRHEHMASSHAVQSSTQSGSSSFTQALRRIRITGVCVVVFTLLSLILSFIALIYQRGGLITNTFTKGGWQREAIFFTNASSFCGSLQLLSICYFIVASTRAKLAKTEQVDVAVSGGGNESPKPRKMNNVVVAITAAASPVVAGGRNSNSKSEVVSSMGS